MSPDRPSTIAFFPNDMVSYICILISGICCLIVLACSFCTGIYKTSLGRMVANIILFDVVAYLAMILGSCDFFKYDFLCKVSETLVTGSLFSSSLWAAFIGHALLCAMEQSNSDVLKTLLPKYTFYANIMPFVFMMPSLGINYVEYMEDQNICTHKMIPGKFDYTYFIFGYTPIIVPCGLSIFWYVKVLIKMRTYYNMEQRVKAYKMLLYPTMLIICWMPILTINMLTAFNIKVDQRIIDMFENFGHLQGFLDALVYGASKKMIDQVKGRIRSCKRRILDENIEDSVQTPILSSPSTEQKITFSFLKFESGSSSINNSTNMNPKTSVS